MALEMDTCMDTNTFNIGKNFNLPLTIIPLTEDALKEKPNESMIGEPAKQPDLTYHCMCCEEYFVNPFQIYEHLNTHHSDRTELPHAGEHDLNDGDDGDADADDDDDDKDYSWVLEPVCELTDLEGNQLKQQQQLNNGNDTDTDTDSDDDDDDNDSSSTTSTSSSSSTSTDSTTITNSNPNTQDEMLRDAHGAKKHQFTTALGLADIEPHCTQTTNPNYTNEMLDNSIRLQVADPHESTSIILLNANENTKLYPTVPIKRGRGRKSAAETAALQLSSINNGEPKCFQCAHCEASFLSAGDLSKHVRCHITNKPFQCSICEKTFTHIGSLNTHIRIHSGEKPYKCDLCSKAFTQSSSLMVHVRSHATKKPHQCHLCDKGFINSSSLIMHLKLHEQGERFGCQECNKTFKHEAQLEEHTKTHTQVLLYQCSICRLAFATSSQLVQHMKCHMGEKPFTCSLCDRSFTQSGSLNIHMRIHTGEKPFQCKLCDKSFTQASSLSVHMKIHSGEKPFPCHICGKYYSQAAYLNKHIHNHLEEQKRLIRMTAQNETLLCIVCGALHPDATSLALHVTQQHAALLNNMPEKEKLMKKPDITEEEKRIQHQQYMQQVELLMQMQQQMIEEVSRANTNANPNAKAAYMDEKQQELEMMNVEEEEAQNCDIETAMNDEELNGRDHGHQRTDALETDDENIDEEEEEGDGDGDGEEDEDEEDEENEIDEYMEGVEEANDETQMQHFVYDDEAEFDDYDDYAAEEEVETAD